MPDRPVLVASERTIIGKKVKRLRREGMVPAIIYGTLLDEPIPVSINVRELFRTYIDYGNTSLIDIELNGDTHTVYIRSLQRHPLSREPLHAKLFTPNLLVRMTASIPIILVGESPNLDGVVAQLRDTIEAEGLPTDLPGAVEIDISSLVEIDDTVWASDLTMPEGVDLITDEDEPLVRLMEVRVVPEDEEVEEVEGEGLEAEAEGEEPAGKESEPSDDEA